MDLELIFSAMTGLAVVGWLLLAFAPLRRSALVGAARSWSRPSCSGR